MLLQDLFEILHIRIIKFRDVLRILSNLVASRTTRDGNNRRHARLCAQGLQPGQSDLTRGQTLSLGDLLHFVDQLQIVLQSLILVLRQQSPEVALGDISEFGDGACQNSPAKRRVGNQRDSKFRAGCRGAIFKDVRIPQGQFNLDSRDGVNLGSEVMSVS